MKKCSKCRNDKDESEFPLAKNRKDGLYPYCKECHRLDGETYRLKNKKHTLSYQKKYRAKNYVKILFDSIKRRAKVRGIAFDLSLGDIVIPVHCPVLGIPIVIHTGVGRQPYLPSVDRIDNTKGYTKDNIIVVSWRANDLKADATLNELRKVIAFYAQYEK